MARNKEYIKECLVCRKSFIATRSDAKYCSATCRSRKTRGNEVKKVINLLDPRNTYYTVHNDMHCVIRAPKDADIAKELNLRMDTKQLIESIKGNKRYTIEYLPFK